MVVRAGGEQTARRRPAQRVYTAIVPLQLIDDIHVVNPLSVAIDAPDIRVLPALLSNFSLQQAVVDGILHLDPRPRSSREVLGLWVLCQGKVAERQSGR